MFCAQCGQWVADGEVACARCGTEVHGAAIGPTATVAAPLPAPEPRFGGFWRRFATMWVDGVVMFFPTAIVRVLLGGSVWDTSGLFDNGQVLLATMINLGLWWLYSAALESSPAQGTLGQQLLGLRVCDDRLRRISFLRATARYAAQWISILTCGIGYLVNLFTKKRQTLHDLVAGCVIARAESLPAAVPVPGGQS